MTFDDAYRMLPDFVKEEADLRALDTFVDLVAANSNYTNTQVFIAIAKLLHNICGTGLGEVPHGEWRQ